MTRLLASVYEPRIPPGPAGGLFLIEDETVKQLDDRPTTGLCFAGDKLVRALWNRHCCETIFLVQDDTESNFIVDAGDPHEVSWNGEEVAIVASRTNEIVWVTLNGKITRRWQASTVPNSWHISGVTCVDDGTVFSAFGRYETEREWQGNDSPVGFLHHIEQEEDLLTEIRSPHSPKLIDGQWWCCESLDRSIVHGSERIEVDGWARGLEVTENEIVVGISAFRQRLAPWVPGQPLVVPARDPQHPRVEFFDRSTYELLRSVELPIYGDVFSVVAVPETVGWL